MVRKSKLWPSSFFSLFLELVSISYSLSKWRFLCSLNAIGDLAYLLLLLFQFNDSPMHACVQSPNFLTILTLNLESQTSNNWVLFHLGSSTWRASLIFIILIPVNNEKQRTMRVWKFEVGWEIWSRGFLDYVCILWTINIALYKSEGCIGQSKPEHRLAMWVNSMTLDHVIVIPWAL